MNERRKFKIDILKMDLKKLYRVRDNLKTEMPEDWKSTPIQLYIDSVEKEIDKIKTEMIIEAL